MSQIKKIFSMYIPLLLFFAFLFIAPKNILAGPEAEIKGSIQAKSDSSITVNNVEVFVTTSTKIESEMHVSLTFDSLKIGDYVIVDVEINSNGKLMASSISLINSHSNTFFQLHGTITAISDNSFFVNETEVLVDSNTIILTQFHSGIKFSDLKVGDEVTVKATQTGSNAYLAVFIMVETENSEQEVELEGKIEALTDSSLTVNNTVFVVNSSTIIISEEHGMLTLNDLTIGVKVSVRGFLREDSTYTALLIKVEDKDLAETDLELHGTISMVDSNSIVVSNVRCYVDSSTVIFSYNGSLLNLSDLQAGYVVEVKAVLQTDGTYRAVRIKLLNDMREEEIEIHGTIDAVNSNNISVGSYTIYINSETKIYSQTGQTLSFGDLTAGMYVKVHAFVQMGNYYASIIKVRDQNKTKIHVTGAIDSIEGNNITVQGVVFLTDANTEILSSDRTPMALSDLKAGQIVSVRAVLQLDGTKYAVQIRVNSYWRSAVIVEGPIDSLSGNSISVSGRTFLVDSSTVVIGNGTGMIDFASLTLGLNVEVKGTFDSSGILKARLIKVHEDHEYEVQGKIDSVGTTMIVVAGLTIYTDGNTVYYDEFDNLVTFDSLKAGQFVEVQYTKTALNENLAVKIEIEEQPGSVEFSGLVTSSSSGRVNFSNMSFSISSNTVFISSTYTPILSSQINAGQTVYVWASTDQNGNLEAQQVQVISGEVTEVADRGKESKVPAEFRLFQNYPNPFNPTTKISFTLAGNDKVTLKVYNVIGQEVAVLINGRQLSAGQHVVDFNGSNLSSGVYFYLLKAGSEVQIKKMILLK